MKNNLLVILSDKPIKYSGYKDYDIINVNKENFGNNEDDLLWSINALNYSNFLKNELEFERPRGYQKVILQKINNLDEINRNLLSFSGEVYNYNLYSNEYIFGNTNHKITIDLIEPFNWLSDSLTYNIVSSITNKLYHNYFKIDKSYWNSLFLNDFKYTFYSHCYTHHINFRCIR